MVKVKVFNFIFCVIWARKNHFEAHLMVLSQKRDSKVHRMAISKSILMRKEQNGDFNVRYFRRFLFGMSPDVPTLKVQYQ